MKMKSFGVLIFVFLSGLCLADEETDNHMDTFLSTAFASEVRSLKLGTEIATNFAVEFEDEIKNVGKVKGKVKYHNGKVSGLDKAKRQSNCESKRQGIFETLTSISCDILFDNLKVEYDGKVKFGKLPTASIKVESEISNTTFAVEIKMCEKPVVQKFYCWQKDNATATISGLGPLNMFLDELGVGFAKHVDTTLFAAMTTKLEYAINRALANDTSEASLLRKVQD